MICPANPGIECRDCDDMCWTIALRESTDRTKARLAALADPIPDWLAAFETWRERQWREGWPDFDVPRTRKSPYISCVKVVDKLPEYAIDIVPLMERSVDGWWFYPLYGGTVLAWYSGNSA